MQDKPVSEKLAEYGFRLTKYAPGDYSVTCPECSHLRKKINQKKPCLSLKIDANNGAVWTCHHCEWTGNVPGDRGSSVDYRRPEPRQVVQPKEPDVKRRPPAVEKFFTDRGISEDTIDEFGIYAALKWMPQTGKEEPCIVFPYREDGQLVNNKYRTRDKHFRQEKDAKRSLFNIDQMASDYVVWVEGEVDVMSFYEAGIRSVVSLPDGAPSKLKDEDDPTREGDKRFEALANAYDKLKDVRRIIIATDADDAGNNLAEEIARRLGKERCSRVLWPHGVKDANEYLQSHGRDALAAMPDLAEPYPIEGLYRLAPMSLVRYRKHGRAKTLPTPWGNVSDLMRVPDDGRLFIVTGMPSSGKSEWLDQLIVSLCRDYGWHATVFSPENTPVELHYAKLAEKWLGMPFRDYGETIQGMTDWHIMDVEEKLRRHFTMILQDDIGKPPTVDNVMELATKSIAQNGSRILVLDPWSEFEHSRGDGSESDYVSKKLGMIKRWASQRACNVFLVAHPAKMLRAKDGSFNVPGGYDISGSAHWYNKADFGITIHRAQQGESEDGQHQNITDVYVWKVRFKDMGRKGNVRLQWNRFTGLYADF